MKITDLDGKNVCFIGYAREGKAMFDALKKYAPSATLTFADADTSIEPPSGTKIQTGPDYLKNLDRFDVVIRSIGVPEKPEFKPIKHKITNSTVIFFDTVAESGVQIVGVTGSKGKSTTANLIYHVLRTRDADHTFFMGNIGEPMISYIDKAKPGNTFVIELSSYMLEYLHRSPHIAVVTSFFPEHIDRHGSVSDYWAAKKNITSHQTADDDVFYNADSAECKQLAESSPGQKIPFTAEDFPLPVNKTQLLGEHNRSNLAAAFKVATFLGVPTDTALDALKSTEGLPYRIHVIGTYDGIRWVEDSLATAPEATALALDALGDNVDTLLTGGMDRGGNSFTELGKKIAHSSIRNIVLFPETGSRIKDAIEAAGPDSPKNYLETSDMQQAVNFAKEKTKKGAICLLSNASPSYNIYKDYEEKAAKFIEAIKNNKRGS